MTAICLTRPNIDVLKDYFREKLPHSRPAHRVEAISAGLGFNTYASLRAFMKGGGKKPPPIRILDIGALNARLMALQNSMPVLATWHPESIQRLLPDPAWLSFSSAQRGDALVYGISTDLGLPMILFHCRRKFAKIEWDYITINRECDEAFLGIDADAGVGELSEKCRKIAGSHSGNSKMKDHFNLCSGWIDNLTFDAATEISDMLALYFNNRMRAILQK